MIIDNETGKAKWERVLGGEKLEFDKPPRIDYRLSCAGFDKFSDDEIKICVKKWLI
jgi:hypothetical protein